MLTFRKSCAVLFVLIGAQAAFSAAAPAQSTVAPPPANALKVSDIIARVEKRQNYQYIERLQWFNDAYIITYYTTDRARVEIHVDPVTGQTK
jgi:DNA-binding LytR/AlgR family response regulator